MFLKNKRFSLINKSLIVLSVLSVLTATAAPCHIKWPNDVFQPIPNPKTHQVAPDYGIYWLKNVNGQEKVMRAFVPPMLAHQFSNGKINRLPKGLSLKATKQAYIKKLEARGFFDPNKPTMIFIHGDQPMTVLHHKRFDLCFNYLQNNGKRSPMKNTLTAWKNWNVGIFYWSQFADDVEGKGISAFVDAITHPEMKIYSANNKAGMRWAYLNQQGKIAFCSVSDSHCAQLPMNIAGRPLGVRMLAYYSYLNAFPKNYDRPIRIAGQSLGTQLAVQLAGLVADNPHAPQPSQLTLLDPYFTPGLHHINVGTRRDSVADYNYHVAKKLLKEDPNLAFSIYRTSKLSEWPTGDRNKPLENLAAYTRICPAFLSNAAKKQLIINEHLSCAYIYFHSKALPIPADGVNANSTAAAVRHLMGNKRYCDISNFSQGCQSVVEKPIHCKLESSFFNIH